ncbi:TonB-dependent receptor [Hymenobacter sp. HMF4947]|uniref:TonB-dependent receptor n=1 Tax=Hymenobacter ginkgonis TaxID=2682976 RepID=A0A7K1TBQ0_9BACT|nr:TonB-dependent receptor [Hymenobacter ginkgonis]MVN75840.1 TonB-dependent receptor [Hymenobacter ginkgonis]
MKQFLLCLLLAPFLAGAQVLQGQVQDLTGRPVPYASVAVPALRQGTTADKAGLFTLPTLPAGLHRLEISAVGYVTASQGVSLPTDKLLTVKLAAADKTIGEVVVTGVSRSTEIRRSPVPIAALGQREIRLSASTNVIDAAVRGIPGLSAVTTGPNISKPFIRGLGYNRVLTLYNGLRQEGQQWGDEHGIEVDNYGVERIEVVKGPASLLYGSDAVAGVVNLIPALPSGPAGELHGEVLAEYQSVNGLLGSSVGLNYQKNGFQTSFRASHRLAHDYRNAVDGLVYNTGFRELTLTGMVGVQRAWGSVHFWLTAYDNHQEIPDGSRDSLSRAFTCQVLEADNDDIKNRPVVPASELRSYGMSDLRQHIQHYRAFANGSVKLGQGELRLLLGVQQNYRQEFNHPTAPTQPGLDLRLTTATYDARYLLPPWHGLELTTGVNGMNQVNKHVNATDFPIPSYQLFDIGGFGVAKKTFGKLELTAGLRYDTRVVRWNDFYVAPNLATGFDGAGGVGAVGARLPFPSFRTTYQGLSASLGGSYALGAHLVLRANVARGYRTPNIPEIGSNGLDPGAHIVYLGNRAFQPEFSLQEDVGVLWQSASWEASAEVFHNYVDNFIYQARVFDAQGQPVEVVPGNATYQYQQAAARLYGGELSLNVHPAALPWLSWRSSVALVIGLNDNPALRERVGEAARYLPLMPPAQARTELRLTVPARPASRLTASYLRLTLDGTARQNRFYAVDGAETATAGYLLLGVGVGSTLRTKAGREAVQLFVQVDNVLNTSYQAHLNRLKYFEYYAASPNGRLGIYNPGRNVGLKMVVPF